MPSREVSLLDTVNAEVYNKQKLRVEELMREKENISNNLSIVEASLNSLKDSSQKKIDYYEK